MRIWLSSMACSLGLVVVPAQARAQPKLSCAYLRDKVAYCDAQLKIIRADQVMTAAERRVAEQKMQGFRTHYAAQLPNCGGGAGGGGAAAAKNDALAKSFDDARQLFDSISGLAGKRGDRALGQLQDLANRPLEMDYEGAGRRDRGETGGRTAPQVDLDDLAEGAATAAAGPPTPPAGPPPSGPPRAGPPPPGSPPGSTAPSGRCHPADVACLGRTRLAIEKARADAFKRLQAVTVPPPPPPYVDPPVVSPAAPSAATPCLLGTVTREGPAGGRLQVHFRYIFETGNPLKIVETFDLREAAKSSKVTAPSRGWGDSSAYGALRKVVVDRVRLSYAECEHGRTVDDDGQECRAGRFYAADREVQPLSVAEASPWTLPERTQRCRTPARGQRWSGDHAFGPFTFPGVHGVYRLLLQHDVP